MRVCGRHQVPESGAKSTQTDRTVSSCLLSPSVAIMQRSSAGTYSRTTTRPRLRVQLHTVAWVLFLCVTPAALHPQCLDFKPPFRPDTDLEFCVMYREFGCCDRQKDQELMARYYRIMENFEERGHESCAGFLLELLCQVSAHGQRSFYIIIWKDMSAENQACSRVVDTLEYYGEHH